MDTRLIRPEDRSRSAEIGSSWLGDDGLPAHFRSEAFAEDLAADGDVPSPIPARRVTAPHRRWSPVAAFGQALAAPFLAHRPARG